MPFEISSVPPSVGAREAENVPEAFPPDPPIDVIVMEQLCVTSGGELV